MITIHPLIAVILGASLLFFGRKLFWLFVATVGFVAGVVLASHFFGESADSSRLVIAIACGLLGAFLAILVRKVAILLAGFGAGGYLGMRIVEGLAGTAGIPPWMVFLVGGVLGAIVLGILFEWALIFLSAGVGSYLIVEALGISGTAATVVFLVLALAGVAGQARLGERKRSGTEKAK